METATRRLGLGVGMDLPWGERIGFDAGDGGRPSPSVAAFLHRHRDEFAYMFVAFQPMDHGPLDARRYHRAYDLLFDGFGNDRPRAFHQTMLNTGSPEEYRRADVAAFTNALAARYAFAWVVEDLGIWSFRGRSLPYPLPPLLTDAGRERCLQGVSAWVRLLDVPLSIEFPGFTEGGSFVLGDLDAFAFFADVVRGAGCHATIDIGHVLAYQWLLGRTGDRVTEGLELLPLERCLEFHLSGCQIVDGRFRDLHHGILLDEQLELLEHLLPQAPHAVGVTYEDPMYDATGCLVPRSVRNFGRLRALVGAWSGAGRRDG
ncbi:MAG: multinuclear nonheme iron-dependent oxidase [Pseudonocardia sp.]